MFRILCGFGKFCVVLGISGLMFCWSAEAAIEWRVENPFRLFKKTEHTDLHRNAFERQVDPENRAPILHGEQLLSSEHPNGWAEEIYRHTCWDATTNIYQIECGELKNYINPKAHRVEIWLGEGAELSGACRWTLRAKGSETLLKLIQAECSEKIRMSIPYPEGARLQIFDASGKSEQTDVEVRDIFIVGVGDSFASGEGNPDAPVKLSHERAENYGIFGESVSLDGYPTRRGNWLLKAGPKFSEHRAKWSSVACHRSLYSYQLRVVLQLALEDPHRAVTYIGFACSGAEIINGLFLVYTGNEWVSTYPSQSQISAVAEAMCGKTYAPLMGYSTTFTLAGRLPRLEGVPLRRCNRHKARKIDLMMLSLGGNDVGFSRLVANAIFDDGLTLKKLGGWIGEIYDGNDARRQVLDLKDKFKTLNRALHTILHIPWSQSDRIILTAYPPIGLTMNGRVICPEGNQGMTLHPAFSVSKTKIADGEKFGKTLSNLLQETAVRHHWTFVREHRTPFSSHGYCARDPRDNNVQESLDLPRWKQGEWIPFSPSDFRPFASRRRWIRTPNDSFLTTHAHADNVIARNILKNDNLAPFQLIFAGAYGGAFHPTAEGQAAIADSVLIKARQILDKYK